MDSEDYKILQKENANLKSEIEALRINDAKRINQRTWYLKTVGTFITGTNLKESIRKCFKEFKKKKRLSYDTVADLGANLIKRFTRLGLLAMIPLGLLLVQTCLLNIQNEKISEQTSLFETQTKLISNQNTLVQQQVMLSEASRRSAQTFVLGDVLSDINTELESNSNSNRILSSTLTGRIISLSRVMKPYRYYVQDVLIDYPLSPERGQLLLSLLESQIDTAFLRKEIFKKGNFQYADLKAVFLEGKYLNDLDLSHADLSGSRIENCSLVRTNFSGYSNLTNTKIFFSNASQAKFIECNCPGLSVVESSLEDSDFRGAKLEGASFVSGTLKNSDFRKTKINSIRFGTFNNIPIMENLRVGRADWLDYLRDSLKIKSSKRVSEVYFVQMSKNMGRDFYSIEGSKKNSAEGKPYKFLLRERKDISLEKMKTTVGFLKTAH